MVLQWRRGWEGDFCTESCLASETDHLLVDTIESRVLSNKEGESSLSESKWLEHDESLAVWVKWRGKWQAAIKCARADVLLVRPINEFPEPIAYRTHKVGMKMALSETARSVMVWKEFAMEASRCKGYSDLGRMLLKLHNSLEWNEEQTEEQGGAESPPVVANDPCAQSSEKKEDNPVNGTEESEWGRLL
ncbi:hypothetical protein ACSBR2_019512 [Camellia fascicularis]